MTTRTADPIMMAIRVRRLALGLSQAEIARRLHCNASSYNEAECGVHSPSLWRLRRIAEELDCDLVLVPRSDPPPPVTDEMAGVMHPSREMVHKLTAHGMSARHIAQRLRISTRTVYRLRAMEAA